MTKSNDETDRKDCLYCENPGKYKPTEYQPMWSDHEKHHTGNEMTKDTNTSNSNGDVELREIDAFMFAHGFEMFPGNPSEMHLPWTTRWYFPGGQTYTDGSKGNMHVDVERGCFWYHLIQTERTQAAAAAKKIERERVLHNLSKILKFARKTVQKETIEVFIYAESQLLSTPEQPKEDL